MSASQFLRASLALLILALAGACGTDSTGPGDDGGDGGDGGDSPPAAPSDLAAVALGPDVVALSWTDNSSDEAGFEIQRQQVGAGGFQMVGTTGPDEIAFVDESVQPATTYAYRVRATAETSSSFSSTAQVRTLDPPDSDSPFECRREGYPCTWSEVDPTVLQRSDSLGDEVLRMLDEGGTIAEGETWLGGQDGIADVRASALALRFRLAGGRPTWVLGPGAIAPAGDATGPSMVRPPPPTRAVVGDDPKTKRALVLSPYAYDFEEWDEGSAVAATLMTARGYDGNVTFAANTARSPGVLRSYWYSWDSFDAIHVSSHGSQICQGGDCRTTVLAGPTDYERVRESTDVGVDLVKIEYGNQDYGVGPEFFLNQYGEGLPDVIIYFSACQTAKGDDMAEALAGQGGTYLGWTETVLSRDAYDAAVAFWDRAVTTGDPALGVFLSMREGDDLTIGRRNSAGQFPTLDIFSGGDDLRVREVVWPKHPLTGVDLEIDESPYPVVGQPGDGEPDRIPYLIEVDGVEGDPTGFVVHVEIDGQAGEPRPLAEGRAVDADKTLWQITGEVAVDFDTEQGQDFDLRARVELPEGGESVWEGESRLGNPRLRFTSTMEIDDAPAPIVRTFSRVEAEFDLAYQAGLAGLAGEDVLRYLQYDVTATGPCAITGIPHDGRLVVLGGDLRELGAEAGQLVVNIPKDIREEHVVTCPEGGGTTDALIYFSAFYAFHGGQICGFENELDPETGGVILGGWTAGSGDVIARKIYDRSCTVEVETFTELTVIELLDPEAGGAARTVR